MRLLPLLFFINSGINIDNYQGLYKIMSSSALYQLVGIFLVKYVFDRDEFGDLQKTLMEIDKLTPQQLDELNLHEQEEFWKKKRLEKAIRRQSLQAGLDNATYRASSAYKTLGAALWGRKRTVKKKKTVK